MMKLRRDPSACCVDGINQFREARQEAIVGNGRLVGLYRTHRPCDAGHAHDDEARATLCLGDMIIDQALAHHAVWIGQADAHGGDDDAVGKGERADLAGRGERCRRCARSGL